MSGYHRKILWYPIKQWYPINRKRIMMAKYLIGWNFMRTIRLILGLVVVGQGIHAGDYLIAGLGALFASTAIFNIGCCANTGACNTYANRRDRVKGQPEDVHYEEVK